MIHEEVRDLLKTLTVLYVEDEVIVRKLYTKRLSQIFKSVHEAKDGEEGLAKFREFTPDLVITDHIMPNMQGLDMIKHIREIDQETPIIITTAYIDIDFLITSINLGVVQFLAKPINEEQLLNTINIAVSKTLIKNLQIKATEQEIELLKLKEKHNETQQQNALKKELRIIENDLFLKKIDIQDEQWIFNVHFEPLETLSGDSYSIREIKKDRYLLFIIDGMGKGLSPSITASLSVAYINHYLDHRQKHRHFELSELIKSYKSFIEPKLLDDEMVAISFVYFKFDKKTVEYALYGMPPLYIEKRHKIYEKTSNNPPLCKFIDSLNINFFSIKKVDKILTSSDGLTENSTKDGTLYAQKLKHSLKNVRFLKELLLDFKDSCQEVEDDLNIALLTKIPKNNIQKKRFCILSRREKIGELTYEIEQLLELKGFSEEFRVNYATIFTELILNAYEHGNLGISLEEKREKIVEGAYDEFLEKRERKSKKKIYVTIKTVEQKDETIVITEIRDCGNGFDTKILENLMFRNRTEPSAENGRGFLLSKALAEEINYSIDGNEVLFIQKEMTKKEDRDGTT